MKEEIASFGRKKDYYDILGVSKTASDAEIKKAFRSLSLKYHPDRNSTPEAAEKIREINQAYEILGDSAKRKQYDMEQSMKKYWKTKNEAANFNKSKALIPKINVGGEIFDRLFGGNTVDIRPQGTAELIFALNTARNANPAIPQKQRKVTTFDFNQKILHPCQ